MNYPKYNLTGKTPAATYPHIVQYNVESSSFVDSLGNDITLTNITASNSILTSILYNQSASIDNAGNMILRSSDPDNDGIKMYSANGGLKWNLSYNQLNGYDGNDLSVGIASSGDINTVGDIFARNFFGTSSYTSMSLSTSYANTINRIITGSVTITDNTNVATLYIQGSPSTGGGNSYIQSTPAGLVLDAGGGNIYFDDNVIANLHTITAHEFIGAVSASNIVGGLTKIQYVSSGSDWCTMSFVNGLLISVNP